MFFGPVLASPRPVAGPEQQQDRGTGDDRAAHGQEGCFVRELRVGCFELLSSKSSDRDVGPVPSVVFHLGKNMVYFPLVLKGIYQCWIFSRGLKLMQVVVVFFCVIFWGGGEVGGWGQATCPVGIHLK